MAAIGSDAAKQTLRAQRHARGLPPDPPTSEAAKDIAPRSLSTEDVIEPVAPSNAVASDTLTAATGSENDNAAPHGIGIEGEAVSVERAAVIPPNVLVNWTSDYLGNPDLSAEQWERRVVRESYEMQEDHPLEAKSQSKT